MLEMQSTSIFEDRLNIEKIYRAQIQTFENAISALEKQIPKKVEEWLPFFKAKCPSCNGHIEAHASNLYCCRCGQALDWSDDK